MNHRRVKKEIIKYLYKKNKNKERIKRNNKIIKYNQIKEKKKNIINRFITSSKNLIILKGVLNRFSYKKFQSTFRYNLFNYIGIKEYFYKIRLKKRFRFFNFSRKEYRREYRKLGHLVKIRRKINFFFRLFTKQRKRLIKRFYKRIFFKKIIRHYSYYKIRFYKKRFAKNSIKGKFAPKKKKIQLIFSVYLKKNNIFVQFRDIEGRIFYQFSAGMLDIKGKKKRAPLTATELTENLCEAYFLFLEANKKVLFNKKKKKYNRKRCHFYLNNYIKNPVIKAFFEVIKEYKVKFSRLHDKIKTTHSLGVKRKKKRRV
jgi:ribosomal protein S11